MCPKDNIEYTKKISLLCKDRTVSVWYVIGIDLWESIVEMTGTGMWDSSMVGGWCGNV